MAFSWKLYGDGKTPPLGEAVAPDERLSWPLTIGIGAQHVVAMFGASMAAPLAIPPTVKPPPSTTASFRTVSVVMIAWAASAPPAGDNALASFGIPVSRQSIGR